MNDSKIVAASYKDFLLAKEAYQRPHDPGERFDPDFMVAMKCQKCGRIGHGPRRFMREALREHMESDCPARHRLPDTPQVTRILFPRQ